MITENAFEAHDFPNEIAVPVCESTTKRVLDFTDECLNSLAISPKKANRLRIAVDEVCTNIVSYSGAASVRCVFAVTEDEIQFSFYDDGIPYNPLTQGVPDITAPAEERPSGGLGILLVRRLMDRVEYRYSAEQNVLTLSLGRS